MGQNVSHTSRAVLTKHPPPSPTLKVMSMPLVIPSEVSTQARESSYGISHVRLNFFLTLFSDSGHIPGCYCFKSCGLPQDDHARPANLTNVTG